MYMAHYKVCPKDILVAAHGIKAIVRHSEGSKYLKRMPKRSQPTILTPCAFNDPKTFKTMAVESSQANSLIS